MRISTPVLAFTSLVTANDILSGLTEVFDGFTSDIANGASVITSAVANPGDAFETITSNIGGAIGTATSNLDGAFETATSRIGGTFNDDDDRDDTTSRSETSENGGPTILPFVEAGFVGAGIAIGVLI